MLLLSCTFMKPRYRIRMKSQESGVRTPSLVAGRLFGYFTVGHIIRCHQMEEASQQPIVDHLKDLC